MVNLFPPLLFLYPYFFVLAHLFHRFELHVSLCCAVPSRSVMSSSFDPADCSLPGSSVHGDSPGRNTEVDCRAFLQEIFSTQGSNPGLPHCRQIPYCLNHQGSPRILEWVDCPFSRGSSQLRNRTRVFCIAGGFFTSCTTREAHISL